VQENQNFLDCHEDSNCSILMHKKLTLLKPHVTAAIILSACL